MPNDPYQTGLAALEQLAQQDSELDRNEDTTRFQLIDPLLTDCLGHSRASITTEVGAHPGFADYIISTPARLLVVEAKREGATFTLPVGLSGRPTVSLATLRTDPTAAAAIEQVARYAQQLGIPLAAIANGTQLAVFLASRADGKEVMTGEAIVYTSLEEMRTGFRRLWDFLSREALSRRTAQQVLSMGSPAAQPPQKLASSITNYPGFRRRTEREVDLKLLSTVFIQDIEGASDVTDDFLRECYYSSGTLSQYAFVSKEILRARYDHLPDALGVETQAVQLKKGLNPALTRSLMATSMHSKPLVLLGDVGVGKTMFIRHLLRIDAAAELQNQLVFYVDFGREPALTSDLETYIVNAVNEQLERDYGVDPSADAFVRAVYNRELNKFRKGIYGPLHDSDPARYRNHEIGELARLIADPGAHLERTLKHLDATSKRRSVLVLDNIDQRPLDFQDNVFVIAQALSASLGATIFVSLRPSTFFESKLRGTLAAYQPRAFHVAPPKVSAVISRRLAFARSQLLQVGDESELSLDARDLKAYLDALEIGFTSNDALIAILENMSGGNTRLALEYLSSFIGSGYVDTRRILEVAESGRIYTIPVHEFIRAIILGENDYFDATTSRIVNVFDIVHADRREHFLLPLLLAYLQEEGESNARIGFVEEAAVYDTAQRWGFDPAQIRWQLDRAASKGLIEGDIAADGAGPFRITSIGAFMHREMITLFSYLDAMSVDTPVIDPSARAAIQDVRSIEDRLERGRVFADYLDDCWASMAYPDALPFDWNVRSTKLRAELLDAGERAARARSTR